ncbi:hypothetical protein D3C73_1590020 [compost metagenome]
MQGLGMPDHQPATGLQPLHHIAQYQQLGGLIEINQHIAQQDHVEQTERAVLLCQVSRYELHALTQCGLHQKIP